MSIEFLIKISVLCIAITSYQELVNGACPQSTSCEFIINGTTVGNPGLADALYGDPSLGSNSNVAGAFSSKTNNYYHICYFSPLSKRKINL